MGWGVWGQRWVWGALDPWGLETGAGSVHGALCPSLAVGNPWVGRGPWHPPGGQAVGSGGTPPQVSLRPPSTPPKCPAGPSDQRWVLGPPTPPRSVSGTGGGPTAWRDRHCPRPQDDKQPRRGHLPEVGQRGGQRLPSAGVRVSQPHEPAVVGRGSRQAPVPMGASLSPCAVPGGSPGE